MANLPPDHEARRSAVNWPGSVLVQAPAGSGKTTLLAQRYLRLLAEVDRPESILALTFTRRAALEMRERVMQALHAAGEPLRPDHLNEETWALGVAARRHMREAGVDLERHPSRMRIETIDAFNAWVSGQLPVTAGAGSRLNLIAAAAPLYQEAARRTLAYSEADHYGRSVERVLALDDQRWQNLVTLIANMLPSRDRWLPLLAGRLQATALDEVQLKRVRQHMDEDLGLLVSRTLRSAEEAVGTERLLTLSQLVHAAAQRRIDADTGVRAWRADPTPLRASFEDLERWRSATSTLLTDASAYRKRLTKNEGFPPQCADKSALLDLITELERHPHALRLLVQIRALPTPRYDDAQWSRVREVAQVLVLAAAQLENVFRERSRVDFPAVSIAAIRALGPPDAPTDLNLRLDYRLRHILVDEFQDTSSAQLELVKRLTAGWQRDDGRTVFCVGDPMQSIYGFRQAEVRAFLDLAGEGIGEVKFKVERLSSNFRSAAPLVNWINACFAQILPREDDRDRGAIAYRASESAARGDAVEDAQVRLRGFASRGEEAAAIADHLEDALRRHPNWRVAVLVRARTHAREVAAILTARQIPFQAIDIEPLQDRAVVRDLVMLICALLHWGDRRAWLALLRAPWMGLTLADLLRIGRAAPIIWDALSSDAAISSLSEDGRFRCERLRRTFSEAFAVRGQGTITRWVEQTWMALGGASCATQPNDLSDVAAVFSRLRDLEAQGLPDAADLANAFEDLYGADSGTAAVEIMTIHKAKGLEFDLVIVPGLDLTIPSGRDELLLSHQFSRAARDGMVMAARPGVGDVADELFEFLRGQARDAQSLEAERLLYVACTRAKTQLHLSALVGENRPRSGSLLSVLWPVAAADFAASVEALVHEQVAYPPRGGALLRVPRDWAPDTIGPSGGVVAEVSSLREETPVFDWAGETARRVGSLVHAELQRIDIANSSVEIIKSRMPHFRRWLSLHGVPVDRLQDAASRVVAALCAVLNDARARWILHSGYRDDFREYAVSGRWQGGVVRVVFDRSFVDDGVRWVIDYKTSEHAGGRREEFLDREVERYRSQLHRYAELARRIGPEPVRVGLYFPLMREWREWEPETS